MKKHYIHVYNIGQGLCTMLRTEPDGENDYLGIFDCGTLRARNLEAASNTIASYAQDRGRIDSIVISHQDRDHWSMLLDIIWKFYGIAGDEIICQNVFYFKKTREESIIYEMMNDEIIEYSNVREGDGYNSSFFVQVDKDKNIQKFELCRNMDKNSQIGVCKFVLSWSNDRNEIILNIFIDDAIRVIESGNYILKPYENEFYIPVPWEETFRSNEWGNLKSFIQDQGIYEQIQEVLHDDIHVRFRWNRFLDNIDVFKGKFTYSIMKNKLSQPKNYNDENCSIGKIWLGGDGWEISYRRLYFILKKLVQIGLVYNVNGFTRDSGDGADIRICGLMHVNESTICSDDIEMSVFAIDKNIEDYKTHQIGNITPAIVHNATSLIVEFNTSTEERSSRIIYPGDATVHVFSQLADVLAGPDIFRTTFFMAPHHGSLHTNYCGGEQQPFHKLLNKLTGEKTVKLAACVISALGEVFGHPDKKFVYDMRNYVVQEHPNVPAHDICYYENDIRGREREQKAIYCTEMMRSIGRRWYSDPPQHAKVYKEKQRTLFPNKNVFI